MNTPLTNATLVLALVGLAAPAVQAQVAAAPSKAAAATPAAPAKAATFAEGEVRKIDKPTGKITLKHGEIKTLDMPPMTMVFGVADPAMLDKLKAGDKVQFRAENQGGKMTVTEIRSAP